MLMSGLPGRACSAYWQDCMALTQEDIIRTLLAARMRISASAWLIVRDRATAEDIFQNVSVKALAGGAQFEREAQLVSWTHITARHEALNWLRARKGRGIALDGRVLELLEAEWDRQAARPEGARVEALRMCMESLPEPSRRVLELRYSDECSCDEVSRELGVGLDAVYQRLSRLHRALRQCIEKRLAGEGLS